MYIVYQMERPTLVLYSFCPMYRYSLFPTGTNCATRVQTRYIVFFYQSYSKIINDSSKFVLEGL